METALSDGQCPSSDSHPGDSHCAADIPLPESYESFLKRQNLNTLFSTPVASVPVFWNNLVPDGCGFFRMIPCYGHIQMPIITPVNFNQNALPDIPTVFPSVPPFHQIDNNWSLDDPFQKQFSQMPKIEGQYKNFIQQFIKYPDDFEMTRDKAVRKIRKRMEKSSGQSASLLDIRKAMTEMKRKRQQQFKEFNGLLFESLDWDFEAILKNNR